MLPSWGIQLSLITFFGIQLFIQIIAIPIEKEFKDENDKIERRSFVGKAVPLAGAAFLGAGAAYAVSQFTKTPPIVSAGQNLNSAAGGPLGSSFPGVENSAVDTSVIDSSVVKRDLQGEKTSTSAIKVSDLHLLPRNKKNLAISFSVKRGIATFGTIILGTAMSNVFTGLIKGHRTAPLAEEESSDYQTEMTESRLKFSEDDYLQD